MPNERLDTGERAVVLLGETHARLTITNIDATIQHVTPETAKMQIGVERARSVEPIQAVMRYSLAMSVVVIVAVITSMCLASRLQWSPEMALVAVLAICSVGIPGGYALTKMVPGLLERK